MVEDAPSECSQNQFQSMLIDLDRMIECDRITVEVMEAQSFALILCLYAISLLQTIDDLLQRDITVRRKKRENYIMDE